MDVWPSKCPQAEVYLGPNDWIPDSVQTIRSCGEEEEEEEAQS
jgi:hypothetical protein